MDNEEEMSREGYESQGGDEHAAAMASKLRQRLAAAQAALRSATAVGIERSVIPHPAEPAGSRSMKVT